MTSVPASELPETVRIAAVATSSPDSDERLLDPYKLAHARKLKAAAARTSTEAGIKPAFAQAGEASVEANRAADDLRSAERALDMAEQEVIEKRALLARDQTATLETELGRAVATAEAAAEAARQALSVARSVELQKSDAAFAAARAVRDAEAAAEAAIVANRLANAAIEPVTIFVSRKEGRVLAQDIFPKVRDRLAERVLRESLDNVSVKLGTAGDPKLPDNSFDRVFMIHMYHEIEQPYEFLWRLRPSLLPGGQVIVVDADRPTGAHGIPPKQLMCEMNAVGFEMIDQHPLPNEGIFLMRFKVSGARPAPEAIKACGG